MKAIRIIGLLVLIALAFGGGYVYKAVKGGAPSAGKNERKVLYWVDPMHPAYKSDKPGIAPDCGMKLEPVYADGGAATAPVGADRKVLYYRDPKDPNYKAQQPGLNPETGSELEPVYADDISTMEVGTVQITPEKQQLIGVKYEQVQVAADPEPSGRWAKWRSMRLVSVMCTRRWKAGSTRCSSTSQASWWRRGRRS